MKLLNHQIIVFIAFTLVSGIAQSQTLDSLLHAVSLNNKELKAIALEYEAILTSKDQVSQLANPQVGAGIPILRPETRLGPQMVMVSAQQMFPWFGTLDSKEKVVISMSKAKYEEVSAIKLELFFQVKSSYYLLAFLNEKKKTLEESKTIYETMESIAMAKVESGESSVADVLRIQLRINDLKAALQKVENETLPLEAKINQLTNASFDNKIEVTDLPTDLVLDYNLEKYRTQIEQHHPLINKINYQIESSQNKVAVSQKVNLPSFGLGLDYSLVNPRIDANPEGNGRDILVPKVMLSIPIYRKSLNSVIRQEALNQQAFEYRKENLVDEMTYKLTAYKKDYDNALLEKELMREQMDKTEAVYSILIADYSASGSKFDELLDTQNSLLQFEIGAIYAEFNQAIAIANIQRITDF